MTSMHATAAHEQTAHPLQARLVEFVRLARSNDFPVGVGEVLDAQRVTACCGIEQAEHLRWGLRSLLCAGKEDWERFDALFDAYWTPANASSQVRTEGNALSRTARREAGTGKHSIGLPDHAGTGDGADTGSDGTRGGASLHEAIEHADFGSLADQGQMRAMEHLVEALARRMRRRLVRRERQQARTGRLHLRHTIRASLPYGGTPLRLAYRKRRKRQPRLLLITDVSRSMSMYSFLFLRFARGIVTAFQDADAFAIHTGLVHITDALRKPDHRRVVQSMALISRGWSGGTRLGESLDTFNREYHRLLNSKTIVIMISDGLDTGTPERLGAAAQELRSRIRKLVWLNPLLGRPGYEPRTGGMLAALPFIDLFAPAHSLNSLAALEPALIKL